MDKELFLNCSCHSEAIKFNYNIEENNLEISFYQQGLNPRTRSFKEKLRWIWHIIRNKTIYGDQVILNLDSIKKLSSFVNEILPNNIEFSNAKSPNKDLKVGSLYILEGESLPFRYIKYSNQEDDVYYFKHHQLKIYQFYDTNKVLREANQKEIDLYNSLKEEMNKLAKQIY